MLSKHAWPLILLPQLLAHLQVSLDITGSEDGVMGLLLSSCWAVLLTSPFQTCDDLGQTFTSSFLELCLAFSYGYLLLPLQWLPTLQTT